MNTDLSWLLYNEYYAHNNAIVEITMKDKSTITGRFTGFFRGDEKDGEPYITAWRIEQELSVQDAGYAFGHQPGRIIKQEDIQAVKVNSE